MRICRPGCHPPDAIVPAAFARRRFPAQLAWLRRRLDSTTPDGLPLTTALACGALLAWVFGGLTQDVLAHEEAARLDPRAHAFALAHRTASTNDSRLSA